MLKNKLILLLKAWNCFWKTYLKCFQVHPKYHNESTNSNLYIFASVSFQSAKPQKSKELGKKNDSTCLSFLSFFSTQTNPVAFLSKRLRLFLFLHVFIVLFFMVHILVWLHVIFQLLLFKKIFVTSDKANIFIFALCVCLACT